MTRERKPNGYWTLENTIFEAKKVMKEHNLDKLPSANKLNELKCSSLGVAINKYHGGLLNFKEKHLGEEVSEKPPNYWKSLENTISEAKSLMKEHRFDRFPSGNKLKELGYGGLVAAISHHHGWTKFRKVIGEEGLIKPNGYWKSLENTISEAKKVMKEHNFDTLPPGNKLNELGYSSLSTAINRHHGGLNKFREKHLGEELLRKPNGYYTLENTIYEAKKVMEEHGFDTFPSQKELAERRYGSLAFVISKYHGGFPKFREIMNQELGIKSKEGNLKLQKPNGYWKILENMIYESKKVMKENNFDTLPTLKKFQELGYGSLSRAFSLYHGGFDNFREKHFGEKPTKKPKGYWTLENAIYESKKVMEEHNLDRLPSTLKLNELYGGLGDAISKYHGGMINFREIMNQELGIKSNKEHLTEVWKKYTGK